MTDGGEESSEEEPDRSDSGSSDREGALDYGGSDGEAPKVSWKNHAGGECKPCLFFHFKDDSCREGDNCVYCHECTREEILERRRINKLTVREKAQAERLSTRIRKASRRGTQGKKEAAAAAPSRGPESTLGMLAAMGFAPVPPQAQAQAQAQAPLPQVQAHMRAAVAGGSSTAEVEDGKLLDGCLEALLTACMPEADRSEVVKTCIDELRKVVRVSLTTPGARWGLEPFGSAVSGFCTSASDLDVVAFQEIPGPHGIIDSVAALKSIQKYLTKHPSYSKKFEVLAGIFRTRVPILKLRYLPGADRAKAAGKQPLPSLDVDMSVNALVALPNTRLLAAYASLDPRIKKLGVAVKLWAKEHGVSGAPDGNLSSYALLNMVIYYLQVGGRSRLPSLQQDGDSDHLFESQEGLAELRSRLGATSNAWAADGGMRTFGELRLVCEGSAADLLCGFFAFYASDFRWGSEVVCVRLGRRRDTTAPDFDLMSRRREQKIHIEDPFERHRNLSDVLQFGNERRLFIKLAEAATKVKEGRSLQVLPGTAAAGVPAGRALLDTGTVAVARFSVKAPATGYKALAYGARVSVLYRGSDDSQDEKGWLFVESTDGTEPGWVPGTAVIMEQVSSKEHLEAEAAAARTKVTKYRIKNMRLGEPGGSGAEQALAEALAEGKATTRVFPVGTGYLALSAGDDVSILHVGSARLGNAGWMYGASRTPLGARQLGWFPAKSLDLTVEAVADAATAEHAWPARVVKAATSAGGGYLSLSPGDEVMVEYVGSVEQDEGWMYGSVDNGREKLSGWFSSKALATPRSSPQVAA